MKAATMRPWIVLIALVCKVSNGVRDSVPTFTVRRSVHPAAFEEEWRLVIDSRRVSRSVRVRACDEANGK